MGARSRDARHHTKLHHATEAASATSSANSENDGLNPGASLATLAAGLAGTPVCMAIQMTQMAKVEMLKNSRVNQSINAATARLSVGSAKAASVAMAGRPSSKARSAGAVLMVAPTDTSENHSGNHRWRCHWVLAICLRQRHSVQMARGHAGQPNHSSSRARLAHSLPPASVPTSRQRHRSSCHAISATAATRIKVAATHLRWWAMSTLALRHTSQAPPRPSMAASAGAPARVSPASPAASARAGATVWKPSAANPKNTSVVQHSCTR